MSAKFWSAGVLVGVLYFLLGWLVYGIIFAGIFAGEGTPGMRAVPVFWLIFLASLSYGLLMSYTFPIGYKGGRATREGMRFGILFALIVNLPTIFFMGAMYEHATFATSVLTLIIELIIGAVLGVVTARIYGSSLKSA